MKIANTDASSKVILLPPCSLFLTRRSVECGYVIFLELGFSVVYLFTVADILVLHVLSLSL